MTASIVFNKLTINGKYQKEWFKIFDLLDKVFSDSEKEKMVIDYKYCRITGFVININKLPIGTTKREFADFIWRVGKRKFDKEKSIKKGTKIKRI